jgi:hypothetical protein
MRCHRICTNRCLIQDNPNAKCAACNLLFAWCSSDRHRVWLRSCYEVCSEVRSLSPLACSDSELTSERMNTLDVSVGPNGRRVGPSQDSTTQYRGHTFMPRAGFEPTSLVIERSKIIYATGICVNNEGISKIFRTGRLERELQVVQLSAIRCSCIAILWVGLVSFSDITICIAFQRVFIVVYLVMTQSRNFWIYRCTLEVWSVVCVSSTILK